MKIISSYKVKIRTILIKNYSKIFSETVSAYRNAVAFFADVCDREWGVISNLHGNFRNNYMESVTIATKKHPDPKYNFGRNCRREEVHKFHGRKRPSV
ncbi:MAG: hypothetical protein LBQ68_09385 [Clostridiales bacterium]|nr:hypothetical protein [Clostridiales bacterium]